MKKLLLTTLVILSCSTTAHAEDVLSLPQIMLLVTNRLAHAFIENLFGILITAFVIIGLILFIKYGLSTNEHDKKAMEKSKRHL